MRWMHAWTWPRCTSFVRANPQFAHAHRAAVKRRIARYRYDFAWRLLADNRRSEAALELLRSLREHASVAAAAHACAYTAAAAGFRLVCEILYAPAVGYFRQRDLRCGKRFHLLRACRRRHRRTVPRHGKMRRMTQTTKGACAWRHPFEALPPGSARIEAAATRCMIARGSYRWGSARRAASKLPKCKPTRPGTATPRAVPAGPAPDRPDAHARRGYDHGCSVAAATVGHTARGHRTRSARQLQCRDRLPGNHRSFQLYRIPQWHATRSLRARQSPIR